MDYKGAFDNLEWVRVIETWREIGCEDMSLWRSFFQGRRACMVSMDDVVWRKIESGCPQATICGPFKWILMRDGLLWSLKQCEYKGVAYADDLLLIVEG